MTLGKRANISELHYENSKPGVVVLPALERPRKEDYGARHTANSFKQKSVLPGSGRSVGGGAQKRCSEQCGLAGPTLGAGRTEDTEPLSPNPVRGIEMETGEWDVPWQQEKAGSL